MTEKKLLQVGEAIIGFNSAVGKRNSVVSERKTVVEIHNLPKSGEEQRTLVNNIIERFHQQGQKGITVVMGENLLDDPKNAGLIDPTKVYVLEI